MSITNSEIYEILIQKFPDALIDIKDIVGDQNHYAIEISDKAFKGLTLINQHKMVKNALKSILGNRLHAVTIKTKIL